MDGPDHEAQRVEGAEITFPTTIRASLPAEEAEVFDFGPGPQLPGTYWKLTIDLDDSQEVSAFKLNFVFPGDDEYLLDEVTAVDPRTFNPLPPVSTTLAETLTSLQEQIDALEPFSGGGDSPVLIWEQTTPMGTWTIPHNFGRKPNVSVYVGNERIITDVTSSNTVATVGFASPQPGTAILN